MKQNKKSPIFKHTEKKICLSKKKENDSRMCIFYEKGFNYLFITENEMRNGFFYNIDGKEWVAEKTQKKNVNSQQKSVFLNLVENLLKSFQFSP